MGRRLIPHDAKARVCLAGVRAERLRRVDATVGS